LVSDIPAGDGKLENLFFTVWILSIPAKCGINQKSFVPKSKEAAIKLYNYKSQNVLHKSILDSVALTLFCRHYQELLAKKKSKVLGVDSVIFCPDQ
jgi:hypothetical protein